MQSGNYDAGVVYKKGYQEDYETAVCLSVEEEIICLVF
jgi:hypothetical protein